MFSINDDALRKALTFLSVAEGRRGLGETSKALRALAGSTALERTRFSESYVLRGNEHGIVHALATAMGTRRKEDEAREKAKAKLDNRPVKETGHYKRREPLRRD